MKQRGGVFILALVVMVAAVAVVSMTISAERVNFKSSINRLEQRRAKMMANAGIERAKAELATLTSTGLVDQTGTWYTLGNKGDDSFETGNGTFRMQIVDAAAMVNLNTAPEPQLTNLDLTQEQIDSLLDWREVGTTTRTEGAKDDFYESLPNPYFDREKRLDSLDEALMIKGWLPSLLYETPSNSSTTGVTLKPLAEMCTVDSFSPNTDASDQAKQNLNTVQLPQLLQAGFDPNTANAIIARRTGAGGAFTDLNQVFNVPGINAQNARTLLDRFTVGTATRAEGKININTASLESLATLPGLSADIADAIVARQATGFANLSEILDIPGITTAVLAQMAQFISIGSDTFVVRVMGVAGSTWVCKEAIIQVANGRPAVTKLYESPLRDMRNLWDWADTATNTITIGKVNP